MIKQAAVNKGVNKASEVARHAAGGDALAELGIFATETAMLATYAVCYRLPHGRSCEKVE